MFAELSRARVVQEALAVKRYLLMGVALVSALVAWRRTQMQNAERELWAQVTDDIPQSPGVAQTE